MCIIDTFGLENTKTWFRLIFVGQNCPLLVKITFSYAVLGTENPGFEVSLAFLPILSPKLPLKRTSQAVGPHWYIYGGPWSSNMTIVRTLLYPSRLKMVQIYQFHTCVFRWF